ncbi:MAG: DUF928 domain-containing protein [Leptolyngbyaceae cyanobacterium CRU_2_3]|nr:DUF928 domain-containing protein [Leptolyngbyaceae cyanobacterium CRU_2_3]
MIQLFQASFWLQGLLLGGFMLWQASPSIAETNPAPELPSALAAVATFEPPPGQDQPRQAAGGGTRGPSQCLQSDVMAQSIAVAMKRATLAPSPSFQIQVPQTSAQMAEFSLFDRQGQGIYQTTVPLQGEAIVKVSLPETSSPLQSDGQSYRWVFAVVCQADDRLQDQTATGWVQWTEP